MDMLDEDEEDEDNNVGVQVLSEDEEIVPPSST
jgi:hypothetical protein